MHQIGLAILLYQNDHAGAYPNSVDEMLEEPITAEVFICPASTDTPSTGATTQAIAADFHKPGHLSYIYLGKGMNDKNTSADMLVLYEPLANHSGDGMSALFGDGHVEWIDAKLAAKVLAAVATGQRVRVNLSTGTVSTSPIAATPPVTP